MLRQSACQKVVFQMFHVLRKNPLNYRGGILDCYHFWFERNFEVGVLKWDYFHLKGHLGHYLFHSGEIVNLTGLILVFDVHSLKTHKKYKILDKSSVFYVP